MARKPSTRVVVNRSVVSAVRLTLADRMLRFAEAIVARADPPDAPPYGVGLVKSGTAGAWVDGKKVGGNALGRAPRTGAGIMGKAGFGNKAAPYARYVELGTINNQPQPFLGPAAEAEMRNVREHFRGPLP